MDSPYEVLLNYGGLWLAVLMALIWIAFANLSNIEDTAKRVRAALFQKWLMKTAVCLAIASWLWDFRRLYLGDAYLRGSGKFEELSTILLGLVLALAAVAWWGTSWRRLRRFPPWRKISRRRLQNYRLLITHGLVLVLILSSNWLLINAPDKDITQESETDKHTIAFIQRRLTQLGCFDAAGVPEPREESFDALTASAVISFQMANDLLKSSDTDQGLGSIRTNQEFPRLTRPFPFLFGPTPCPKPSSARRSGEDMHPPATSASGN